MRIFCVGDVHPFVVRGILRIIQVSYAIKTQYRKKQIKGTRWAPLIAPSMWFLSRSPEFLSARQPAAPYSFRHFDVRHFRHLRLAPYSFCLFWFWLFWFWFFWFLRKTQPRLTTKLRQSYNIKKSMRKVLNPKYGWCLTMLGDLLCEHGRWLLGLLCAFGIYAYELHALVVAKVVGFYHET